MPSHTSVNLRRISITLLAVLPLVFVAIFISPRDQALKNQDKVIHLLRGAYPEITTTGSRIERVILSPRVMLVPEQALNVFGYTVRLHVRPSVFTIEAHPLTPGKTGGFSFFRDEDGVVRFEPELGKPASAESRPWNPPLPQK